MHQEPILQVKNLAVQFSAYRGIVHAVRGVSFSVHAGEALGIVGESGCGKSVTAQAILRLLPEDTAKIAQGTICLQGRNLLELSEQEMCDVRGNAISMIFQDPMTSLNPVQTIGAQIMESLHLHKKLTEQAARERTIELLRLVGIPQPENRLAAYPHQFSGGMRQRVMIAMALAGDPLLLLADEPTTALDVTIQAQILELLADLKQRMNTAIVLISHDLGVIAKLCEQVAVMYAGEIVERGTARDIFYHPQHPYTQGLLQALPRRDGNRTKPLAVIEGQPPDLLYAIQGCAFMPRCPHAMNICAQQAPAEDAVPGNTTNHCVKCWLLAKSLQEGGDAV